MFYFYFLKWILAEKFHKNTAHLRTAKFFDGFAYYFFKNSEILYNFFFQNIGLYLRKHRAKQRKKLNLPLFRIHERLIFIELAFALGIAVEMWVR
jgi:hypothetical protein